jgi:hypothetical protein
MQLEKSVKNIRTKMTLVTPTIATKWLGKNNNNRRLRDAAVGKLSDDMTNGRWKLTHQGIAFNCDGTLLDGQHRLAAIIQSNTSQWMSVTVGLPRESVSAIDDNLRRSVGDSLQIVHGITAPSINRAAAAAAWLVTGHKGNVRQRCNTRGAQTSAFLEHQKAIEWALNAFPSNKKGLCRAAVLAVIARAYYSVPRTRLAQFCAVLADPGASTDVKADSAIFRLRDYLIATAGGGGAGAAGAEAYRKTERVLAAWLDGEQINRLTEATEELFPIAADKSK